MGGAEKTNQKLATSAALRCLGFAASAAIAFVTAPIIIGGLGETRYGIWALIESVVVYLSILDLGISASVVRYVAKFEAEKSDEGLNRLFNTALVAFALLGALALLVAAAFALGGYRLFSIPEDLRAETSLIFALLGANLAIRLPAGVFDSVLCGLGRFPTRTAIDVTARVSAAGATIAVVWNGGGLVEIALVALATTVATAVMHVTAVRFFLPRLRISPWLASLDTFREIRGYSARAFVAMIAGRVSFASDSMVIAALLHPGHVTYFVVAARLADYVKGLVREGTSVLMPAVSALDARRSDPETLRDLLIGATRYVLWFVVPVSIGLLALGRPFLTLWLGPRIAESSYPVLVVLSVPLMFCLSQSVTGRFLFGLGDLRWLTWIAVGEAGANLTLSILLVREYGIVGVAVGTAVPSIAQAIVLSVYTCRRLRLPVGRYLQQACLLPCLIAVFPAMFWNLVSITASDGWAHLVVLGALGALCYAVPAVLIELAIRARRASVYSAAPLEG